MHSNDKETGTIQNHLTDPKQWVTKYADYLYAYAITRINEEDLAKDLVQETFLAALQRVDKFEGRSSEKTWLTAILKNKVIDVYRKKSSGLNKKTDSADDDEEEDFFDQDSGHWNVSHQPEKFGIEDDDPLMRKELAQILQLCMQKLPALWSSVFTMKHMDDESAEVICSELKVSSSNFWVIIHRAKVSLRACLQKNWV